SGDQAGHIVETLKPETLVDAAHDVVPKLRAVLATAVTSRPPPNAKAMKDEATPLVEPPPPPRDRRPAKDTGGHGDDGVNMVSKDPIAYGHYVAGHSAAETNLALSEQELTAATNLDPGATAAWIHLAMVALAQRGPDDPVVTRALAKAGDALTAPRETMLRAIANDFAHHRDPEPAAQSLVQVAPDDPAGWAFLGAARESKGNLKGAIDAASTGLALDPDMQALALELMRFYGEDHRPSDAARVGRAFLALHPGDALVTRALVASSPSALPK
ncbi:MAG TPA: hypothetical protein VGO62_04600, partial [Myxococcota bacterium]